MLDAKLVVETIKAKGTKYFVGVPDSLLKDFLSYIQANIEDRFHITAVNEGNAVSIASGIYLSTGIPQVVYMQNSGLGNAVNPLTSLAHQRVYSIPLLLVIGWRGEPGVKDEPQHEVTGEITSKLLDLMDIPYFVLDDNYVQQIKAAYSIMNNENKPVALLVRKGIFNPVTIEAKSNFTMLREAALSRLLNLISPNDVVLGTTGKSSREIYEIRENNNFGHQNDFLTIGSMGHISGISKGIIQESDKLVYCIDGDGSLLMHMGALSNLIYDAKNNFKYVLVNNASHQSVGGQETLFTQLQEERILHGMGIDNVYIVEALDELDQAFHSFLKVPKSALVLRVSNESRDDLSRPKESPIENKQIFMEFIRGKK